MRYGFSKAPGAFSECKTGDEVSKALGAFDYDETENVSSKALGALAAVRAKL